MAGGSALRSANRSRISTRHGDSQEFSWYGRLQFMGWRHDRRWPTSPWSRRRAHRSDRSNRGVVRINQSELAATDRDCAAA